VRECLGGECALSGFFEEWVREVQFFEKTAGGIDVRGANDGIESERRETRNYCAEMARVASLGTLEEGLVFLWAMEKVRAVSWLWRGSY